MEKAINSLCAERTAIDKMVEDGFQVTAHKFVPTTPNKIFFRRVIHLIVYYVFFTFFNDLILLHIWSAFVPIFMLTFGCSTISFFLDLSIVASLLD